MLTFQFLLFVEVGEFFKILSPDIGSRASSSHSRDADDEAFTRFFGLFSELKKVQNPPRVRVRSCGREVSSSTPAAYGQATLARVSTRMKMAAYGARHVVTAQCTGGTLTHSIPNGGRRGKR